jgi:hypothetical protein
MWNVIFRLNVSATQDVSHGLIHRYGESLIYFRYVLHKEQETGNVLTFIFGVGLHSVNVTSYIAH